MKYNVMGKFLIGNHCHKVLTYGLPCNFSLGLINSDWCSFSNLGFVFEEEHFPLHLRTQLSIFFECFNLTTETNLSLVNIAEMMIRCSFHELVSMCTRNALVLDYYSMAIGI